MARPPQAGSPLPWPVGPLRAPHSLQHGWVRLLRCEQRAPGVHQAGPAEEHGGPEKGMPPTQAVTPQGVSGPRHTVGACECGVSSPSWKVHPWRALTLGNALPSLVPQVSSRLGLRVAWKGPSGWGPVLLSPASPPRPAGTRPASRSILPVRPPPPPGGRSAHPRGHLRPASCPGPDSQSTARRPGSSSPGPGWGGRPLVWKRGFAHQKELCLPRERQ